jgi:hypothetical protein
MCCLESWEDVRQIVIYGLELLKMGIIVTEIY